MELPVHVALPVKNSDSIHSLCQISIVSIVRAHPFEAQFLQHSIEELPGRNPEVIAPFILEDQEVGLNSFKLPVVFL